MHTYIHTYIHMYIHNYIHTTHIYPHTLLHAYLHTHQSFLYGVETPLPRSFLGAGFRPRIHPFDWFVPLAPKQRVFLICNHFEWAGVDIRWLLVDGFDTRWTPRSFSCGRAFLSVTELFGVLTGRSTLCTAHCVYSPAVPKEAFCAAYIPVRWVRAVI